MTFCNHAGPQINRLLVFVVLAVVLLSGTAAVVADTLDAAEQAAFDAAVDRVASAVVQIETVGGLEKLGKVLFGAGPTTGLVVDPDGYIISSAFNFVNKPTSILVRLSDGSRRPAKLVATDHSRMLVLLKIDVKEPLPFCEIASSREMRVGQWVMAVGRTFRNDCPNLAVGILSAVNRIWGKAIQTDAAVSPNNYGGPLIDLRGRVLGVLVPLSPKGTDEIAGTEWYDSGIGFAIPAEQIEKVLPRLKKGEDLYPGLAGISLKGPNLYTGAPIIAACRPKCPATTAGLKPGDLIVEVDGRPTTRAAEVREQLGRRYAGDTVNMTVLRGKKHLPCEIKLAAKLEVFQHGFLGILPMRSGESTGVAVRYVYPKSPAAAAGIAVGDVILALDGRPVRRRIEFTERLGAHEPGDTVELDVRRADAVQKLKIVLARLPEDLPSAELPPARKAGATGRAQGKALLLKVPEFANEVWTYVPADSEASVPCGVVVWLHTPGGFDWKKLLARWRPLCDRHDLILVAPKSSDPARWVPGEAALVDRLLAEIASKYDVDPARVVVHGHESGGALAFLVAFRNRAVVRAVAAVEAAPPGAPPENDPAHRLAIYVAWSEKSRVARPLQQALAKFERMKIPVTAKKLGDVPRSLNGAELAELARWIDTLDRI